MNVARYITHPVCSSQELPSTLPISSKQCRPSCHSTRQPITMYRVWAATLIATTYLHIATATNGITELDSSLNSRGFRGIPRPGRVADDFPPVPGPVPGPIPRLGDRPKTSPGDDLNLPKRPLPGSGSDGPDAPNSGGNDPYVPPKVPDLSGSTLPSKVENKGLGGEASGTYHPCSPSRYDEKLCLELIGVGI